MNAATSTNNIEALRKARGWSRPVLARAMGTSYQQVEKLEKGTRRLAQVWIDRAATAFNVPATAIIDPSARPDFETPDHLAVPLPPANGLPVKMEGASNARLYNDLPIYGSALGAARDVDGEAIEQTTLNRGEVVQYVGRPTILNGRSDAYGLYVVGSSMAPRFEDGEMIIVDPKGRLRVGDDIVIYLRTDNAEEDDGETSRAVLVKRLVRRTAAYIEVQQFDPPRVFKIDTTDIVRTDRVLTLQEMLG